jgi:CubicO group peptidase (beta-lactamase class C family)
MKTKTLWLAALLCLFTVGVAQAQGLQTVKPEQVGLSSDRLGRIMTLLQTDVEKGTYPGAILLVARHGKIAWFETVGVRDPETKLPMTRDTIFRIYSMSKPITSLATMMLVEDGKLALSDPVSKYIPAFGNVKVAVEKRDAGATSVELVPMARPMTIQDLLRHTAGLTYGFFGEGAVKKMYTEAKIWTDYPSNEEFVERLARLPLAYQPGTTWDYSHATDVLGRVIEVVAGTSLLRFTKERILDPLGMRDTSFYVTDKTKHARIAEPFKTDRSIGVEAEFNDPRVEQKWESGGGGLVSTTMDYARFAQMLLNGGALEGNRIIGRKTLQLMASDHLGPHVKVDSPLMPAGHGFGLGFAVRTHAGIAPFPGSTGQFFWSGMAGTFFWIDPAEEMFAVFMMQGPGQREYIRSMLRNLVYAAVE